MEKFLESILNQCLNILESDSGSILLLDKNKQDIVVRVARGAKSRSILGERVKVGQGISGLVAQEQKPLIVEDIRKDEKLKKLCRNNEYSTHSFLSVPLTSEGRLVGVLNVTEKSSGMPFTIKELSFISAIAASAAATIDKLSYVEQLEKQIECFKNSTAVTQFTSALAHELNNPLDGTLRYNKLALIHSQDNEIVREYLLEMRQGLKRMENTIRSMLKLSFAGKCDEDDINRDEIDVNETLNRSIDFFKHEAKYKDIEIETSLNKDLPKLRDCGIQQIFLNCIKNSIDSIDRNGKLTIKSYRKDDNLVIDFVDTGKGVDPNLKDKIFEPFFSTKPKGQGLGLSIVKEVVNCYKGKINIENLSQGGARFTFSIPIGGKS
jgi:signal transduction histidine kinase